MQKKVWPFLLVTLITTIKTLDMANQNFPFDRIQRHFKEVLLYAPGMLGNDAVNFFLDRFKDQAWIGNGREPWQPRKAVTRWGKTPRNKGRALLVDTGRLRRSIRITSVHLMEVTVGSDVPYAKAHNEGMRLGLIQNVKAHKRKVTKLGITGRKELKTKTNIQFGRVQTGETIVRAHKRRIDQRIPKRQFMGNSPFLANQLKRRLTAELMKGIRTINNN